MSRGEQEFTVINHAEGRGFRIDQSTYKHIELSRQFHGKWTLLILQVGHEGPGQGRGELEMCLQYSLD